MKKQKYLLGLLVSFFFEGITLAQFGSSGPADALTMGLAKTYSTTATGVYSIGINPSNLIFFGDGYTEFSSVFPLPYVSGGGGTNFMSLNDFDYYFGGVNGDARYLDPADKQKLNDMLRDGGELSVNLSAVLFSVMHKFDPAVGAFALSAVDYSGGRALVPYALVDLGLNGNEISKIYSFDEAAINSWWIRSYALSYARELPEINQTIFDDLAAGISLKYISGYYYLGLERINTSITTGSYNQISGSSDILGYTAFSEDLGFDYDFDPNDNNKMTNIGIFPQPAGSGFGFDFGLSAGIGGIWKFALAVTDIGSINWTKNAAEYSSGGNIIVSELNQDQTDSLENLVDVDGHYISSFSSGLPSALRMGASFLIYDDNDDVPGSLLLALDFNQGFNYLPGNSKIPRFSLGANWIPMGWLHFRSGISVGGLDEFNWALGLGFDTGLLEFNLATTDLNDMVAINSAKRVSVSFNSRWKFQ